MSISNITTLLGAIQKLTEMGFSGFQCFRHVNGNDIIYFMINDCDIGYYTLNTLFVHDQPRNWHTKSLKTLKLTVF